MNNAFHWRHGTLLTHQRIYFERSNDHEADNQVDPANAGTVTTSTPL